MHTAGEVTIYLRKPGATNLLTASEELLGAESEDMISCIEVVNVFGSAPGWYALFEHHRGYRCSFSINREGYRYGSLQCNMRSGVVNLSTDSEFSTLTEVQVRLKVKRANPFGNCGQSYG